MGRFLIQTEHNKYEQFPYFSVPCNMYKTVYVVFRLAPLRFTHIMQGYFTAVERLWGPSQ